MFQKMLFYGEVLSDSEFSYYLSYLVVPIHQRKMRKIMFYMRKIVHKVAESPSIDC